MMYHWELNSLFYKPAGTFQRWMFNTWYPTFLMLMLATIIFAVLENPLTIPQILALSTVFPLGQNRWSSGYKIIFISRLHNNINFTRNVKWWLRIGVEFKIHQNALLLMQSCSLGWHLSDQHLVHTLHLSVSSHWQLLINSPSPWRLVIFICHLLHVQVLEAINYDKRYFTIKNENF